MMWSAMSEDVSLSFELARPNELQVVFDILDEAASWLDRRNISQWPARFSGVQDWRSERIAGHIEAGHTWLVRTNGEAIATFTLDDDADPDYARGWPDGANTGLYIFRMAVGRASSGQRVGTHILNWASKQAAEAGKRWLRLDCHRRNLALQHYYERHGFVRVGTLVSVIADGDQPYTRGSGALYQRPAGSIEFPDEDRQARSMTDRYDPTGEAAIWQAAAELVSALRRDDDGPEASTWNAAIEQAARALDGESRGIRQRDGMYFRVISGNQH
jgi:ribosomal protein S18 acetylase RimI-like enzyme